jgi:hypothetical protein
MMMGSLNRPPNGGKWETLLPILLTPSLVSMEQPRTRPKEGRKFHSPLKSHRKEHSMSLLQLMFPRRKSFNLNGTTDIGKRREVPSDPDLDPRRDDDHDEDAHQYEDTMNNGTFFKIVLH